jgi:hypothetical protein
MTSQLTLPDYVSSSPVFSGVHVAVLFGNGIVRRLSASNYLFGIFKLFFTSESFSGFQYCNNFQP